MGIPDEDVAAVRSATDLVALIGEHVALKRQGRRWVGLCPFHGEKTPSFSVNAEEGFYHCFGCQASGDAITFVRQTEHLDFVDAVRTLADRAGVAIREDASTGRDARRRHDLLDAMGRATEWYHERLVGGSDAGGARDYLRSRGYDGDVVRRFRLGWAPDEWDALSVGLGLDAGVATAAGLAFVNRRGRLQDAFRARILFPIFDPSGRPVALGGRVLPGSSDPAKYKNSPETPVYSKRKVLYGLNWAKHEIIRTDEVVVCEGYTDVIGLFGVGIERAVATCGTALADEHVRLLRGFARRIVLAFDADTAGQAAAGRFYEWERALEVDVAVAALPAGSDPGELARTDPDRLRAAVEGATPFLQFRVDGILDAADLSTPEGRARSADHALAAVGEHPDNLVRDQYVMQVAERCGLEPSLLRQRLDELRRRGPLQDRSVRRPATTRPAGRAGPATADGRRGPPDDGPSWVREPEGGAGDVDLDEGDDGGGDAGYGSRRRPGRSQPAGGTAVGTEFRPGLEALRLAIHRPDDMGDRLDPVLFPEGPQRAAFEVLLTADDLHQAIDGAPSGVRALLVRLTVEEPVAAPGEVVVQLVRAAARRELGRLAAEARSVPEAAGEAAEMATRVQELDDPDASADAADRLLAWLVVRSQTSGGGRQG